MIQHTPGPWVAKSTFIRAGEGLGGGDLIARTLEFSSTVEQAVADARLMAAAPDLLAALIDLKHLLAAPNKHLSHYRSQCESAIRDAEAAIAKARGAA